MTQNKISFYLLLISQAIGLVGGAVLRFAIALHVLDLTGSAEIFATIVAVSFLPMVLLGPLGGAIADRFDKKKILVISDSANAVIVGALALFMFGGVQSVVLLGAAITLLTVTSVCYFPTVTASLPTLLSEDELPRANGLNQGIKAISALAGPILAGFLFGAIGVNMLVGMCAVLFLFSACINVFIKIAHKPREAAAGIVPAILGDMAAGFVYVTKENKTLLKVALLFTVVLFFYQSMLSVTFPYMIRVTFNMSEQMFGIANAAIGVAILAGSLLSGRFKNHMEMRHLPYYVAALGIMAVPVAISAAMNPAAAAPFVIMVISFMMIMFVFTLTNILVITYTQTQVPKHMMGKAMTIIISIANASTPIGQFIMGMMIENLGDGQFVLYLFIAAATVAMGLVFKRGVRGQRSEVRG